MKAKTKGAAGKSVVLLFPYGESNPDSIRVLEDDGRDWDGLFAEFRESERRFFAAEGAGRLPPDAEPPNVDEFLGARGAKVLAVKRRFSLPA
jgi:hypothetical protein